MQDRRAQTADLIQLASFERFFESSASPLFVVPIGPRGGLGRARPNPALGRKLARAASSVADREGLLARVVGEGDPEIHKVLEGGSSSGYRTTVNEVDGPSVWAVELSPLRGPRNETLGVVGAIHQRIVQDVVVGGEDAGEGRLAAALGAAGIGTWTWEVKTGRMHADGRFAEILGRPARPVELSLPEFLQCLHPDERSMVRAALLAHVAGRTPMYRTEHRTLTDGGAWRWLQSIGRVFEWTQDEEPALVSGIVLDISHRKAVEAEISRMGRELREIVESIPGVVYRTTFDELSSALYLSEPFEAITGHPSADFVETQARSFASLIDARDRAMFDREVNRAIEAGTSYEVRYRIRHATGETRWVNDRGWPKRDAATGEVRYLSGVLFDVTELQEQQTRLDLLEAVVENANDGVLVTEGGAIHASDLQVIYVNEAFVRLSGYSPVEVLARSVRTFLPVADHLDGARDRLEQLGPAGFEIEAETRAGNAYWAEVSVNPIIGPQGVPTNWVFIVRDISERKRHELRLLLLESAVENAHDGIVIADNRAFADGGPGIVYANAAFQRQAGFAHAELLGQGPHILLGPETEAEKVAIMGQALERSEPAQIEMLQYRKDGSTFWSELSLVPLVDERGEQEHWVAVYRDVSERRRREAELRSRAEQLRVARDEAEKATRAKSSFLATMSHEIRTPMNGVIGMTSLLNETALSPVQQEFVDTIRTSGDALLTLINDILDFSKIEAGQVELEEYPFSVVLAVEEALELVAPRARAKGLRLGYVMNEDVPGLVRGDVTRLRQVLVNLCGNAVKFTETGTVSVAVRLERIGDDRSTLRFEVRDTGIGIPQEGKERLFAAFSQMDASISRRFGGTGLGLAISRQLVELMGGQIGVESQVGQGSTFWFTVDVQAMDEEPSEEEKQARTALAGKRIAVRAASTTTSGMIERLMRQVGAEVSRAAAGTVDLLIHETGYDREDIHAERRVEMSLSYEAEEGCDRPGGMALREPLRRQAVLRRLLAALGVEVAAAEDEDAEPEVVPLPAMRVLLVEDNVVNQKVALNMLARLGLGADVAHNGQEALEALGRSLYDVVLMDMEMPVMDGLTATRAVRETLGPSQQPRIIALTANAMDGDAEACLEAGMDDYLSKPIRLTSLREALQRAGTADERSDAGGDPEG